jgi:hypothetical protein
MKNNKGILDCVKKTFTFMFRNEVFTIDLTEGDLDDNINAIKLKNGDIFDFNLSWQKDCKPVVSLYAVDGFLVTDWEDSTSIKITHIIGTEADYFGYEFDNKLPLKFQIVNSDEVVIYKTKSLNKASDELHKRKPLFSRPLTLRAIDTRGAVKEITN